ncbi:MAG: M48 family metalloprotease [Planctomycetes bacterium]|nr:M48 family metalloprotease [Planctomycetota bacterium]
MLILQDILSQEIVQRLGWTLLHFIWQAAAVALIMAILLRVLRKSTANVRYIFACLALALIVLLPVITINLVPVSAPLTAAHFDPAPVTTVLPTVEMPAPETLVIAKPPQPEGITVFPAIPFKQRAVDTLEPTLPYIVSGWLIGVFGLSIWHLGGWTQLQRLKRRMVKQVDSTLLNKLKVLTQKLKVKQTVQLMESALIQIPTVVGWLRPVILLPASALTGLSSEQLEAIIAHELAHIKRLDYLINILQTVVEILGFYHPAVWWVSHKIRAERENCCDDIAVSISGDRVSYAGALASMEEIRAAGGKLAVAATGGNLFRRICRLLGKDSTDNTGLSWVPAATAILLIIALAIPTTIALTNKSDSREPQQKTDGPVDVEQLNGQTVDDISATKAFMDVHAILDAWEAHYGTIQTMKVRFSEIVVGDTDPEIDDGLVRNIHVERIQDGTRYYQRHTKSEEGFTDKNSIIDESFDGTVSKQYITKAKRGRIVSGAQWGSINHVEAFMMMSRVEIDTFKEKYPRGIPWFSALIKSEIEGGWAKVRPELEYVAGEPCHVIENRTREGGNLDRFWIAHNKGMLIMKHEVTQNNMAFRRSEILKIARTVTDKGEFWYPSEAYRQLYLPNEAIKNVLRVYEFVPHLKIPPDTFDIHFPDGTRIIDEAAETYYVKGRSLEMRLPIESDTKSLGTKESRPTEAEPQDEESPVENIPPVPLIATSPAPSDKDKAHVKVNFLVVEVPLDSKIDTETLKEAENILGGKVSLHNTKVNAILRQAAQATAAAKNESDRNKRVTEKQFNALVKKLDSKGYMKILMNPMIETLNGKTATVRSAQHVPLRQKTKASAEIEYVDVVDLIEITPHDADGHIILDIEAELGSRNIPVFEEPTIPVSIRSLSTQVRANPGETLIIGGLTENPHALGDNINNTIHQANEVLFIITPTTMTPPNNSPPPAHFLIEIEKVKLADKLKRFGIAVAMYADDHDDNLPESIQELKPYLLDERDFDWFRDNVEYFDKGKTAQRNAAYIPIAYDKTLLEKADGTNVLFLDFSVRFRQRSDFEQLNMKRAEIMIETWFLAVNKDFIENINHNADSPDEAKELFKLKSELLVAKTSCPTLNDKNISLLLKAVRAHKDSKILAAPQVICWEDKRADIAVMSREYYHIKGYTEPNNPPEKFQEWLDKVEEGIKLSLKPKLVPNNNIEMDFKIEISQFLEVEERELKGSGPKVQRRTETLRYRVQNGEAFLFGGHKITYPQDGQTEQKDLLILIKAHTIDSSEQDKSAKTENLIVNKPAIIQTRTERPNVNDQEKNKPPTERGRRPAPPPDDSLMQVINKSQRVQIFKLKHHDISQMARILSPLITKTGHVGTDERTNSLIVSDTAENLTRIEKIIAAFDVLQADQTVQKFFKLKYYSPSQMGQILMPLLTETGYISADENTGNLLVIDTVDNLKRIELIIKEYDVPKVKVDETVTEIFEIRNGDPVEIVKSLRTLINEQAGNGSIIEQGKEPIVLIPQPTYNWIIAKASAEDIKQIGQWIKKLDTNKSTMGLDPIDEAVHEQLEMIVDLSDLIPGTSFGEVVEKLENSVEPPLQIQPIWKDLLENAEVEQATPAGMDSLPHIKLRKALEILLTSVTSSQLGELAKPTYIVDEGVILIGTVGMLSPKRAHRVYDISDQLETNAAKTSPENIKQIAQSIDKHATRNNIGIDPIDKAVYDQLETIVDLSDLGPGTSFGEVIEKLENSVSPPLQIQPIWKDLLDNAEFEQATPASMDPLPGIKLSKALEILIASVTSSQLGEFGEITYIVDDGVILIGSEDLLPPKMVHRVYDISDLIEDAADADDLIRRITETIEPDSWYKLSAKGEGTILAYPVQEPKNFAVMQTYKIHQQITRFLEDTRSSRREREKTTPAIKPQEMQILRQQYINNDIRVKSLSEKIAKVENELIEARQQLTPSHPEVRNKASLLRALKKSLQDRKNEVGKSFDDTMTEEIYKTNQEKFAEVLDELQKEYEQQLSQLQPEITARMESAKKLSNLGKALLIYANDHNDKYPDSLFTFMVYLKGGDFSWIRQNAEYLASGKTPADRPDIPLAYDKTLLAKGIGTNVLYNDCHVSFEKAEELKKLGISESEIMIETIFLSVSENYLKAVGLDANPEDFSDAWRGHLAAKYPAGPNGQPYGLFIDDLHVSFLLKNIQADHDSKAIVTPRVLTRAGTTAEIAIMTEEYYFKDYNEPNNPSDEPEPKLDKVEIGTRIWLTPKLTDDNRNVNLDFKLEITQLEGIIESKYKGKYPYEKPIVDVVSAKMPCTIPDGKTMLIGGLKIIEHVTKKPRTPGLKDLPLIGAAFRSKDKIKDQKMLLILVKPITNPQQKATKILPGQEDSEEHIKRLAEQLDKKINPPGIPRQ